MSRNIEVGCLVMLVGSDIPNDPDIGRCGKVTSFDDFDQVLHWAVYFDGGATGGFKNDDWHARDEPVWVRESQIKRIDDYTEETETQEEECEV